MKLLGALPVVLGIVLVACGPGSSSPVAVDALADLARSRDRRVALGAIRLLRKISRE